MPSSFYKYEKYWHLPQNLHLTIERMCGKNLEKLGYFLSERDMVWVLFKWERERERDMVWVLFKWERERGIHKNVTFAFINTTRERFILYFKSPKRNKTEWKILSFPSEPGIEVFQLINSCDIETGYLCRKLDAAQSWRRTGEAKLKVSTWNFFIRMQYTHTQIRTRTHTHTHTQISHSQT